MEKSKETCLKEKKEYDACLIRFHNWNPNLCNPEKIWFEMCMRIENLNTSPSKVTSNIVREKNA